MPRNFFLLFWFINLHVLVITRDNKIIGEILEESVLYDNGQSKNYILPTNHKYKEKLTTYISEKRSEVPEEKSANLQNNSTNDDEKYANAVKNRTTVFWKEFPSNTISSPTISAPSITNITGKSIQDGRVLEPLTTTSTVINETSYSPFNNITKSSTNDFISKEPIRYEANWKSLDTRPTPKWYDKAKIGIFVHWGVYSVPAFGTSNHWDGYAEWFLEEWKGKKNKDFIDFMKQNYPPNFEYPDFVPLWKAEFFNASEWADLVEQSGAKYFILTTKHHDGYTLWRSNNSLNWNSVDTGPRIDIVGELSEAIRKKDDIHYGLYYSLYEWFHPLYLFDKSKNFTTQEFVKKVLFPQMYDYVTRYKPEYIWSDGDWEANYEYWNSPEFIAWLYNDSPVRDTIVVNDRWGIGTACKHGDVKTCGIDRFNPHFRQRFKWENAMTIDRHSWGYRKNANITEYLTMYNLTSILAETVSCGGNLVMNIGPTADGRIIPIFQERLRQMGSWLKVNGEGIYATRSWRVQNDTADMKIWYTKKESIVYAIVLEWPENGVVILNHPIPTAETQVSLLGLEGNLSWQLDPNKPGLQIYVSAIGSTQLPCKWAWTFKLTHVE